MMRLTPWQCGQAWFDEVPTVWLGHWDWIMNVPERAQTLSTVDLIRRGTRPISAKLRVYQPAQCSERIAT